MGGDFLWLCFAVSYFYMCRASEPFANGSGKIHNEFGLTKEDVA